MPIYLALLISYWWLTVWPSQVFDHEKVLILGVDSRAVTVGDEVQFKVDRKLAGNAELNITVISPLGQVLNTRVLLAAMFSIMSAMFTIVSAMFSRECYVLL